MKTLFKGAKIIDGIGGAPILPGELLIEDEKILELTGAGNIDISPYEDIKVIDLTGKIIIPGLINSHVHIIVDPYTEGGLFLAVKESDTLSALRGYRNMQLLLSNGITYTRDCACPRSISTELSKARKMGLITGTELITAGEAITTTGGHVWQIGRECDGVYDVRKAVREQIKAGADFIKIIISGGHSTPGVHPKTVQFTKDEIEAAVEIAHFANKKISAHANGLQAIGMAVDAGIDSIEHCEFFPDEDLGQVERVIEKMVEQGTFYVPTLSCWFNKYPKKHGFLGKIKDEELGVMNLRQPDHIRPMNMTREYFSTQQIIDNATRLYKAGVRIAMGTDSGAPLVYFDRHPFEMKLMLLMGMSPMEVLLSATKNAAELLDISRNYGTLAKGKIADFVVLNSDPLHDMDALYDIYQVYKKGYVV